MARVRKFGFRVRGSSFGVASHHRPYREGRWQQAGRPDEGGRCGGAVGRVVGDSGWTGVGIGESAETTAVD